MSVTDVIGDPVNAGDVVAAAFRDSTRAYLRVGKVLGFGERGNRLTVNVHWTRESNEGGPREIDIIGGIDAELFRFVRLAGPGW